MSQSRHRRPTGKKGSHDLVVISYWCRLSSEGRVEGIDTNEE